MPGIFPTVQIIEDVSGTSIIFASIFVPEQMVSFITVKVGGTQSLVKIFIKSKPLPLHEALLYPPVAQSVKAANPIVNPFSAMQSFASSGIFIVNEREFSFNVPQP